MRNIKLLFLIFTLCVLLLSGCGKQVSDIQQESAIPSVDGNNLNGVLGLLVRNKNYSIEENQNSICLKWTPAVLSSFCTVVIRIIGNDTDCEFEAASSAGEYIFTAETCGKYEVEVTEHIHNSYFQVLSENIFLLSFDLIPEIPIFYIYTDSGNLPYREALSAPDGLWGETIQKNVYETGIMYYADPDTDAVITSSIKIRVRGNTSSVNTEKVSYKIKLDTEKDLLNLGDEYENDEFALLNSGTNLKTYIGTETSELIGMDWVPQVQFVNVVINDDWRGIYVLSETVQRDNNHVNIQKDGFIVENDAYWWNAGDYYFKVANQADQFAFTFKYPKNPDMNSEDYTRISEYMSRVISLIDSYDEEVFDYIDEESFAKWLLVKDFLFAGDCAGSNMYYYIESLDAEDEKKYQLKMGPQWDFDSILASDNIYYSDTNGWSEQHLIYFLYFDKLLTFSRFRDVYRNSWNAVSDSILDDIGENLDTLLYEKGDAIRNSRKLDAVRWERSERSLQEEIEKYTEYLSDRVDWMNTHEDDY